VELPNYETDHYELDNAEEIHRVYPDSFWMPKKEVREALQPGNLVKLIFRMEETIGSEEVSVERMWVKVTEKHRNCYVGVLSNDPAGSECVKCGQSVRFQACHVIEVYESEIHN
jgi:uncharacterized protein YegJ (DUF2314 family)